MKRIVALLIAVFFVPALSVLADPPNRDRGDKPEGKNPPAQRAKPVQFNKPVIINMTRPSSGGHNMNFPSQRPIPKPENKVTPSYGRLPWSAPNNTRPVTKPQNGNFNTFPLQTARPNVTTYAAPGLKAAVVVHHHPYTPGYVRKKLQNIGVKTEPAVITDRGQILHTDRVHSVIHFPTRGPNQAAIAAKPFSPRRFNDPVVRNHMARVDSVDWRDKIASYNSTEDRRNHYYWHRDNDFNYCHYVDDDGYQWWGWYVGDQFFWNRYYAGRWWWYDPGYDRWCFWNDGYWWWQDPYHVGDLYCYNDDNYIPCNSAADQEVVVAPVVQDYQVYNAPDGSCQVRIMPGTQDAFLYDTDDPENTHPVYLASGATDVMFSNTSSGRPLEVVLKLNDGTFDMFDDDGNSYSPGNYDADQANQDDGSNPPTDPPTDNGTDGN